MNKIMKNIIKEIEFFESTPDCGDRVWRFYLFVNKKWLYVSAKEYEGVYYIWGSEFDLITSENFEIELERLDDKAQTLFKAIPQGLKELKKKMNDSVKFYRELNISVPPQLKMGVMPRYLVQKLIPEYMRYDLELTPTEINKAIEILSKPMNGEVTEMTAEKFFNYCKIAYLANGKRSHKEMNLKATGKELYARWADGRDGGLRNIPVHSSSAFKKWYEEETWLGGHPWEIYRGGNSTHINLSVNKSKFKNNWKIIIRAYSSTRLAETCRIIIELNNAGYPFELMDHKSYLARLLKNDLVGVIPDYMPIKYAWHDFPREWGVSDCIHYSFFKDEKGKTNLPIKQIKSMISWFPLNMSFKLKNK